MTRDTKRRKKKIKSRIKILNKTADERSIKNKKIEILERKLRKIDRNSKLRKIDRNSKLRKYIKNKHTRQFPINKLSYQENEDVPLPISTRLKSRKTKKVKKKRGFFNFLRIPNFRRKTQKSRSLLSHLSQSITGLSKKIPGTTRTSKNVNVIF